MSDGSGGEEVLGTESTGRCARRPDITMIAPDGNMYHENVGLQTRSGRPVARERRALADIERMTGERVGFTAYNVD